MQSALHLKADPVGIHPMARIPVVEHRCALNSNQMTQKNIIAAILITAGCVVLAFSGITFTTPGETVQFIGLRVETTHTHFIPPIVGAISLICGIVLLMVKPRIIS